MTRDPVCHVEIREEESEVRGRYEGLFYFFCCEGCRELFYRNPEKYLWELARLAYR